MRKSYMSRTPFWDSLGLEPSGPPSWGVVSNLVDMTSMLSKEHIANTTTPRIKQLRLSLPKRPRINGLSNREF